VSIETMSLKKRTVTPSLLRKYEVLRYLYLEPKTTEQLFAACSNMEKRHVITALANLLNNHAIKKENIPEEKATDDFFNEGPKSIKKKSKNRYVIVPNGERKLAYYEWKYQLYTEISPNVFPWNDEFNQNYYDEMKKIIIEDLKLPT
jgi:hypothetical protein